MSYNKEYYAEYRKKNKDKISEKNRLWRLKNPQKEFDRKQRQRESGYTAQYQRDYRTTPQSKYSSLKSRAKTRGIAFDIDKGKFIKWFNFQAKECCYCHTEVSSDGGDRKRWLTIDRMSNNELYTIGNIVISCYRCNLMKSDDISFLTMLKIGEILEREIW